MSALLVTGTGSGVGATVVAAGLAALAVSRGQRCTVVKPAQVDAGDDAAGDVADVVRLAGDDVRGVELARYPDRLSPAAAARRSGRDAVDPAACVAAVLQATRDSDLVLVDSGPLLVRYDDDGFNPDELARTLRLPLVVVVPAGGDAVSTTALTLEAAAHRGLDLTGLVIGCWPEQPGVAERSNVADLEMLAARPLLGALPAGLGSRDRADFLATARAGLSPALGGTFDTAAFRRTIRDGET